MSLLLRPPIKPMLARAVGTIPSGMAYEPKWDGFRCLVFRHNDDVVLQSRHGKDLAAYFPDLVEAVIENTPHRCILDGEIVVISGDRLDFTRTLDRVRGGSTPLRAERLARDLPASYVCYDVLALDSTDLTGLAFRERRKLLERALETADPPLLLSPSTLDIDVAHTWFEQFEGAGLDGVIAKPLDGQYTSGQRTMYKIKHDREADVVVVGYRLSGAAGAPGATLGSLQLGLHDETGTLHFVGATSAFSDAARRSILQLLLDLTLGPGSEEHSGHPWSSEPSPTAARRPALQGWRKDRDPEIHLIDPPLVATVGYDHMEGTRFRNATRFVRWRPDRTPESCTFDQLEAPVRWNLADVLGG